MYCASNYEKFIIYVSVVYKSIAYVSIVVKTTWLNKAKYVLLKGLRLVMWSLLHDTDQLREMLSTDQSLRDRRSRGLWSVLSISRG